jgi:uncharacterized membrane protein (UPF0136 family)
MIFIILQSLVVLSLIAGTVFGIIFFIKGIKTLMKNEIGPSVANLLISVVILLIAGLVFFKLIIPGIQNETWFQIFL